MIIDSEHGTKSPISSGPNSPQGPSALSPVSYSTFPAGNSHPAALGSSHGSDLTALLARDHPVFLSSDDLPPAYDDILDTTNRQNRFWVRWAAVALSCLLLLSAWVSYQHTKSVTSTPDTRSPKPPIDPTSAPPSATGPSSLPNQPQPTGSPLPIDPIPLPGDCPFVLPDLGRTDLCRPWAYSPDSGVYPAASDKLPTERLVYYLTTLAPLHLETVAICPTSNGTNAPCAEYDDLTDAVSGKLRVTAADIELPMIEVFLQHGSELGLEDVSLCLTKRPLAETDRVTIGEAYKWYLSISIWKDPTSVVRNNLLASLSIIITLPSTHTHHLTTRLNYFNQFIGYASVPDFQKPSFGTLQLAGDHGRIEVWSTEARTIDVRSNDGLLSVANSRIGDSLRLSSVYGMVTCNVTLVQAEAGSPVKLDLESEAGVVEIYANLEYSLSSASLSQFDIKGYSRHSRALIYITDYQGTLALRNNHLPAVLPIIRMNLSSKFAITEAVIPATYAGSIDLRSQHAEVGIIDWAKDIAGRSVEWSKRELSLVQGTVNWSGVHAAGGGSLHASTEFAAPRLLLLGLDGSLLENWPEKGTEWKPKRTVNGFLTS